MFRNTLDCDQSTPRTFFSPTEFGPTGNSAAILDLVEMERAPFDPPTPKTPT